MKCISRREQVTVGYLMETLTSHCRHECRRPVRRKKLWDPTDDPWKHDMYEQLESGRPDRYQVVLFVTALRMDPYVKALS